MFASPKLRIIALLALGIPGCAMAANNPAFNGYYGGLMVGIMQTDARISASTNSLYENFYATSNQLNFAQNHVKAYNHSGVGDLYLGFGHFFGDTSFYWAAEIYGNWAKRSVSLNNEAFHEQPVDDEDFESITNATHAKLDNFEYGIDFRPGFQYDTNTLVYGRIGVAFNEATVNTRNTFSYTTLHPLAAGVTSDTIDSSIFSHKNKGFTGLRLGVGVEHLITTQLAVTADYIYTYYGRVNTFVVGDTASFIDVGGGLVAPIVNVDGFAGQSSAKLSTQSGMLGLKYYFYPVC